MMRFLLRLIARPTANAPRTTIGNLDHGRKTSPRGSIHHPNINSRRRSLRSGKVNPIAVALVPPIIFLAGLMVYNGFRAVVPEALAISKTQQVEAMEVLKGIASTTKKGLEIPQAASLRAGGSSRLVIARPANDAAYLLVAGTISASFIGEKVELDRMLYLRFSRSALRVESGGKAIDAVLLYARTETNPLVVDDPSTNPEISVFDLLFANQTLLPVPGGMLYSNRYESDNGMKIEVTMSTGQSGAISLTDVPQLNFKIDSESTAWIEMPKTVRVQHKAVGTENLNLGMLIPLDDGGSDPFTISLFNEQVASVNRP